MTKSTRPFAYKSKIRCALQAVTTRGQSHPWITGVAECGLALSPRSEFRCCAREKFPVRALPLPIHQYVKISRAFRSIRDGLALVHPVEPHDGSRADDANDRTLIFQRQHLRFAARRLVDIVTRELVLQVFTKEIKL